MSARRVLALAMALMVFALASWMTAILICPTFFSLGLSNLLALGHHKHLVLRMAACAALQRLAFLFLRALRGEKALVYLHASAKQVLAVALAHDAAQFVEHLPYGLVTLVSELPLKFVGGESPLRGRQHVHGEEPG